MNRCSKCSLEYDGTYGKSGHCCGHCQGGHGHGKNCTASVICQGCGNEIEIRKCKYRRSFEYYCCGHCHGRKGRHGRRCVLWGQERGRSRTPPPSTSRMPLQQQTSAGDASTSNASADLVWGSINGVVKQRKSSSAVRRFFTDFSCHAVAAGRDS